MIASTIFSWFALTAAPSSGLPTEAVEHNERGVAMIEAGQVEAGVAELEQAYAALPDPLKYRVARGMLAGSLRSALNRHYQATGAPVHLCRLRRLLHRHRTELLAALGANGGADDVAGTDGAIAEIDATLAGRPCEEPPPPTTPQTPPASAGSTPPVAPAGTGSSEPPPPTSEPPPPPPLHPADRAPSSDRRLRGAGGALLGLGGLAFVGSAVASGFYGAHYRRLDALERRLDSPEEVAEYERRAAAATTARTAAIVVGSAAAVLIAGGVAALVKSRSSRRVAVAPSLAPTAWGFTLEGRF